MSKMIELIEEMRARLNQVADTEQSLVRALSEALNRVDQKLLQDVRDITTDHESRRGAILHELQNLASRIGAFPIARDQAPGLDFGNPAVKPITGMNGSTPPSRAATGAKPPTTSRTSSTSISRIGPHRINGNRWGSSQHVCAATPSLLRGHAVAAMHYLINAATACPRNKLGVSQRKHAATNPTDCR